MSHTAQEASWMQVFDPAYTLLFDLYHQINLLSDFTNLSKPGSISAGFQWTGSIPAGLQEGLCAV